MRRPRHLVRIRKKTSRDRATSNMVTTRLTTLLLRTQGVVFPVALPHRALGQRLGLVGFDHICQRHEYSSSVICDEQGDPLGMRGHGVRRGLRRVCHNFIPSACIQIGHLYRILLCITEDKERGYVLRMLRPSFIVSLDSITFC
jgi:hypothetical protein